MDPSVHSLLIYSVLMVIVTLSAIIDYNTHRIPNWLSFSGWYLGPILHLYFSGSPGLSASVMGLLVVLALTFPLFVLNWMGAGDVKLMTSVAAMVGIQHALIVLASIFITGFVVSVILLIMRGAIVSYARRYWMMLGMSLISNRPVYVEPEESQRQIIMPYAISIAIGTLISLCLLW